MIGIGAALHYLNKYDKDYRQISLLQEFGISAFLKYHLSIPEDSLESRYIQKNIDHVSGYLARVLV